MTTIFSSFSSPLNCNYSLRSATLGPNLPRSTRHPRIHQQFSYRYWPHLNNLFRRLLPPTLVFNNRSYCFRCSSPHSTRPNYLGLLSLLRPLSKPFLPNSFLILFSFVAVYASYHLRHIHRLFYSPVRHSGRYNKIGLTTHFCKTLISICFPFSFHT